MKVSKDFKPKPGDRFYSKFFDSEATVVRFTSPKKWVFVLDRDLRFLKAKAKPWEVDWIYIKEES
jgi:hypothetical protein